MLVVKRSGRFVVFAVIQICLSLYTGVSLFTFTHQFRTTTGFNNQSVLLFNVFIILMTTQIASIVVAFQKYWAGTLAASPATSAFRLCIFVF
jgi:hypothetical protein